MDITKEKEPAPSANDTSSKNNNSKYKYTPNCGVCQARIIGKLKSINCLYGERTDFMVGVVYGKISALIEELEANANDTKD